MIASRIIPPSNLPSQSQPWARFQEESALSEAMEVEALETNTIAAYKQLNTSVGAVASSLASVQDFLYSLPRLQAGTLSATGISLAANTWTPVVNETVSIPSGLNRMTILTTANIDISTGGVNSPPIWFSLYPGSGDPIESACVQLVTNPGPIHDQVGHASISSTYIFPTRRGGTATIRLSLWCSAAVAPTTGSANLGYELIAGGTL